MKHIANEARQMTLPAPQQELLELIAFAGEKGITAAAAGKRLYANNPSARSRSASAAQNTWELIRKGLVGRKLVRRELYRYFATEAGKETIDAGR